jgi:enamine deaminase RidA (YjgF/YER057c/UK114 family)
MSRRNVTHGTAIEDIFGYSTGTRYGREVYVAGQLARDSDGNQIASTALSDKFARVTANIHKVLTKLEAESVDLVYVQVHVADDAGPIGDVIELCRNHFGEAEPAITIVPVNRLNDEGANRNLSHRLCLINTDACTAFTVA